VSTSYPSTAYPVADSVSYLRGLWHIEREIHDRFSGETGTFRGTAVFAVHSEPGGGEPDTLQQSESGELTWQGVTRPAGRVLRLHAGEEGALKVTFADGRPFHDLDLRSGHWSTAHPCAADDYTAEFEVLGPDGWQVTWRVRGPAKDMTLTSFYSRIKR
jgi:hypothetical protein